jgi:MFS family permease
MPLMTMPVMTLVLTDIFAVSYWEGTLAAGLIPLGVPMVFSIPAGRLFDHIGIMKFRAMNAALWSCSWAILFLAAWRVWWPGILIGFFVQGLGRALGHVAFNIGHTRFAPPERSGEYMGVHMTLQGLRGTTMPFVGTALFAYLGLGPWAIGIAAAVQSVAAAGFFFSPAPPKDKASDAARLELSADRAGGYNGRSAIRAQPKRATQGQR